MCIEAIQPIVAFVPARLRVPDVDGGHRVINIATRREELTIAGERQAQHRLIVGDEHPYEAASRDFPQADRAIISATSEPLAVRTTGYRSNHTTMPSRLQGPISHSRQGSRMPHQRQSAHRRWEFFRRSADASGRRIVDNRRGPALWHLKSAHFPPVAIAYDDPNRLQQNQESGGHRAHHDRAAMPGRNLRRRRERDAFLGV